MSFSNFADIVATIKRSISLITKTDPDDYLQVRKVAIDNFANTLAFQIRIVMETNATKAKNINAEKLINLDPKFFDAPAFFK